MFSDVDIPAEVKATLEAMEKLYEYEDLSIALLSVANSIVDALPGEDKSYVFQQALDLLKVQLDEISNLRAFEYVFVLGIDGPTDWNRRYIQEQEKKWKGKDPVVRRQMMDSGEVLTKWVTVDGKKVRRVISTLRNWKYDRDGGRLTWEDETYWESESDPVVFIDMREKLGNSENFRYKQPLMPRWSANVIALVGVKQDDKIIPKLAKISIRGNAANPNSDKYVLRDFARMCFKFYKNFRGRVIRYDGDVILIDGRNIKHGEETSLESTRDIRAIIGEHPKMDVLTTEGFLDWAQRYATRGTETVDYNRYFYAELTFTHLQKFPSGDIGIHLRDSVTPKEYDFQGSLPEGITLEDFGAVPGSKVRVFGRLYNRRTRYNRITGESEETPWVGINIMGMRTYLSVDFNVAEVLEGIGMKTSLTEE